jgi:hypothetical protein
MEGKKIKINGRNETVNRGLFSHVYVICLQRLYRQIICFKFPKKMTGLFRFLWGHVAMYFGICKYSCLNRSRNLLYYYEGDSYIKSLRLSYRTPIISLFCFCFRFSFMHGTPVTHLLVTGHHESS